MSSDQNSCALCGRTPLTGAAGAGESQTGIDEHICQHVLSPTACERQHFTAQPELRLTKHNTVVRGT